MKTITSAVLGLSLTLASTGLIFAAQTAPPATTDHAAPVAKKHVKKSKKSTKADAAASSTAPAASATAPASK